MSTNYDFHPSGDDEDVVHIGKRSAAGMYCHKCSKTLCEGGEAAIHTGRSPFESRCSGCGGVHHTRQTCSFTWAIEPHKLAFMLYRDGEARITDEFGGPISAAVFYEMLRDMCRIQFYDSIGKEFS